LLYPLSTEEYRRVELTYLYIMSYSQNIQITFEIKMQNKSYTWGQIMEGRHGMMWMCDFNILLLMVLKIFF